MKGYIKMAGKGYLEHENKIVQSFVNTALKNKSWIYKSAGKH